MTSKVLDLKSKVKVRQSKTRALVPTAQEEQRGDGWMAKGMATVMVRRAVSRHDTSPDPT
jgi:hypothetical protein